MPEKLLTKKEAAEYLGIPEKQIDELVGEGKLPAYRIGNKFLRFKHEHLDALGLTERRAVRHRPSSSTRERKPVASHDQTVADRVADLLYFNDFYIISFLIITGLIAYMIFF